MMIVIMMGAEPEVEWPAKNPARVPDANSSPHTLYKTAVRESLSFVYSTVKPHCAVPWVRRSYCVDCWAAAFVYTPGKTRVVLSWCGGTLCLVTVVTVQ